eukprot:1161232-Pelagomonas_calceolata.AAC.7
MASHHHGFHEPLTLWTWLAITHKQPYRANSEHCSTVFADMKAHKMSEACMAAQFPHVFERGKHDSSNTTFEIGPSEACGGWQSGASTEGPSTTVICDL